ncbi:MAG: SPOR domain-containing protein [Gemmatimonadales bacterium]
MTTRPLRTALVLLLAGACQSDPSSHVRGLSVASTTPPSSLLRLPAAGGIAELYRLPRLEAWGWKSVGALPPLSRPVGADLDQGLIYALGAQHDVVALDLQTARPRLQLISNAREIAMGPDGTLYTVDDSLRVVQFVRRNPVRFSSRLPARPRDLFGTRSASLLAISSGPTNALTLLRPEDPPTRALLPTGDAAATFWGDLLAIAADSVVLLVDPARPEEPTAIKVEGHARAVLFSPSGHRFYVARREGGVLVFNRFTRNRVAEIDLPGGAGALRVDPFGRWLLVHPPTADSVWLVDLATNKYVGGVAAEWAADLPTVTNQQVLLVKSGGDVVAYNLALGDRPESGRIKGGAADYWLPLAWTPETGTAGTAPTDSVTTVVPGDSGEAAPPPAKVFLQVSSSQNHDWSAELARQLSEQGLPATVLDPGTGEEGFRVVLGPYPSREVAESTGRRLGRPFFIYQPDR